MELSNISSFQEQFKIIVSCLLVFFFSLSVTWLVLYFALRKSILDIPNERSSHIAPIARGGGIAIVLSFTLSILYLGWQEWIEPRLVWALAGGGLAVAALGFCDDLYSIKIRWRLLTQFIIAAWALYWLGGFTVLDVGTWKFALDLEGYVLATIGIVWCINLYNFMDGIDGLAGSEGVFVGLSSGIALWWLGMHHMAITLWLLAAAIGGFVVWNWQPAKIFLGDVGSAYLGYVFAIFAIYTANNEMLPISFWAIILAIFLCDSTFTLIQRFCQGKRWYSGHREHAFHVLILNGATHKQVTMRILLFNCCILLPAAYATLYLPTQGFWLLGSSLLSLWLIWFCIKVLFSSQYNEKSLNQLNENQHEN